MSNMQTCLAGVSSLDGSCYSVVKRIPNSSNSHAYKLPMRPAVDGLSSEENGKREKSRDIPTDRGDMKEDHSEGITSIPVARSLRW